MARSAEEDHTREKEVRVWREATMWVAKDVETGIASQGDTRIEALEMLDEAVALHQGKIGESIETPRQEREVLRELGIDPDEVESAREENDELPLLDLDGDVV